ncbi:response regulator [Methylocella sp.]|uniref:response regulator n=1 Tax=Methylocella sp. TaxID=1978226 RepID=UPI00378321C9
MAPTRILVVDDEPQIHRFLKPSLAAAGYEAFGALTAAEALEAFRRHGADLVVLDLGLPDCDGKELIRAFREKGQTPIVVLSARDQEDEKVQALDLGADDYVNKPFGVGELMARIRTALRRNLVASGETAVYRSGDLVVDTLAHSVTLKGAPVKLTPKEFDVLRLLVRHAGRVLTHRQILTEVWGPAHVDDAQYLRVFVRKLRQKLEGDGAGPRFILTEPGVGYRVVWRGP